VASEGDVSLANVRPEFVECPTCLAKPGSPALCRECLERRELYGVVEKLRNANTMGLVDRLLCRLWPPTGHIEADVLATRENLAELVGICPTCNGTPDPECKEHGR
jgi:hypothetical protein